jgi:hypothetical protein
MSIFGQLLHTIGATLRYEISKRDASPKSIIAEWIEQKLLERKGNELT